DHRLRDRGCLRELFSFHGVRRRGRCGERRLEGGRPVRRGTTGLAALPRRSRGRGARSALPRAHRRVRTRGPDSARDPPVRAGRGTWRRRARRALPNPPHVPVRPALTALGVIPARLASTRLPRKVLRDVAGKPLIVRVHEAARRSPDLADVLVATDAQEVITACARFGVPAMPTSREHPSGTDRVWEVAQSRAADVYVNIQGAEPLITPRHVALLVAPFTERPGAQVTPLKIRLLPDEADNPNVNKMVCAADGRALYFSKYPVRDASNRASRSSTVRTGYGISIPSARRRRRIRFLSSCWTTYWSTNDATSTLSVKSSDDSPNPGMRRTNGAGWARSPGICPNPFV